MMDARLIDPAIEEASYHWLIAIGDSLFGISSDSGWCMRVRGQIANLDYEDKFMPLGPLLDVKPSEFSAYIDKVAKSYPAIAHWVESFPKEKLLKYVFHSSYSSYWPVRALAWLEADRGLWPNFTAELHKFSANKDMPQSARQKAFKLLKKAEDI